MNTPTQNAAPPTRTEAMEAFRSLIGRYGLQWNAAVPESAYDALARASTVLTAEDRRAIATGRA